MQKFIEMAIQGEMIIVDMLHAPKSAILESSQTWEYLVEHRGMFYTKNMKAYLGYIRKQTAKYGVKGSRLAVIEESLNIAKSVDNGMGVRVVGDYLDSLPIGEFSQVVTTRHPSVGEQTFYEICGRKFQTTLKIGMFVSQLESIYKSYGERAQQAKDNLGIDWKAVSHALRAGYQLYYIYKDGGFSYPLPETQFLLSVKQGKLDFITEVQPALESLVKDVETLASLSNYPDKVNVTLIEHWLADFHSNILYAKENFDLL